MNDASPWLLPSLYRRWRSVSRTDGARAEYAHRTFTNVVPFDETKPTEPSTGGRYGWGLPVPMVAKLADAFVFCSLFLHTDSYLGVLRLVELVWTRATTPCP